MTEIVAAGAAVAKATPSSLQYLEDKLNAFVRRRDLFYDNENSLERCQELLKLSLEYVEHWINERADDFNMRLHGRLWKTRLQHAANDCNEVSQRTRKGNVRVNVLSRVRRVHEILARSEDILREFFDFVNDVGKERMKPVESTASMSQTLFNNRGSVPPNPPRLTQDYESQTTYEGKLKAAILDDAMGKSIGVVAYGRGGLGKTCALRGLCGDSQIKDKFEDGVQFMTLGKDAGKNKLMQELARIVERTGDRTRARRIRDSNDLETAVNETRIWFDSRKCLFIVDDVWNGNGFDTGTIYALADMVNEESCLVWTTRDPCISLKGSKCIEFQPRTREESRAMFLKHAGLEESMIDDEKNKDAMLEILAICGGIPLLLAVSGASVRHCSGRVDGPTQNAVCLYYQKLRRSPGDMFSQNCDGYGPVRNIVEASLSVATDRWRESMKQQIFPMSIGKMFRSLCVLEKQQAVPVSMLQRLWGLSDKKSAVEVMDALSEVGLVQVTDSEDFEEMKSVLRVHDEILDLLMLDPLSKDHNKVHFKRLLDGYCTWNENRVHYQQNDFSEGKRRIEDRLTKNSNLGIMRRLCCWKRYDNEREQEKQLQIVDPKDPFCKRQWWKVEDDGFLHENLFRLLLQAGEYEELSWVRSQPQWFETRVAEDGLFAFLRNISIAANRTPKMLNSALDGEQDKMIGFCIQEILMHQILIYLSSNVISQLAGWVIEHLRTCETCQENFDCSAVAGLEDMMSFEFPEERMPEIDKEVAVVDVAEFDVSVEPAKWCFRMGITLVDLDDFRDCLWKTFDKRRILLPELGLEARLTTNTVATLSGCMERRILVEVEALYQDVSNWFLRLIQLVVEEASQNN